MPYANEELLHTLRSSREAAGISQRQLSVQTGIPQSHISKIESGSTDMRVSSLIEIARALDLELVLLPRKLLPAVEALTAKSSDSTQAIQPAYTLDEDENG